MSGAVLVGVFDVDCVGMGSGLNNVETYLAHSDCTDSMHPFQRAFGFLVADVWGLINCYIDTQWPDCTNCSDRMTFKKGLLLGFLHCFDGYQIGSVAHVFSPYAVVKFLMKLKRFKVSSEVPYRKRNYWARTG
ncbi:hypothetical protein LPJ61_007013, partial [Coemansia biformis]